MLLKYTCRFLPICCTESEEINLSGIFTIENNFLPFRNFNSCLDIFFCQLRPCDVLKGICLFKVMNTYTRGYN